MGLLQSIGKAVSAGCRLRLAYYVAPFVDQPPDNALPICLAVVNPCQDSPIIVPDGRQIIQSSAKRRTVLCSATSGRSFMYRRNRTGPRTVLWGETTDYGFRVRCCPFPCRRGSLLLSYIIVSYCQISLLEPCSGQWPNFEEASFGWWSM